MDDNKTHLWHPHLFVNWCMNPVRWDGHSTKDKCMWVEHCCCQLSVSLLCYEMVRIFSLADWLGLKLAKTQPKWYLFIWGNDDEPVDGMGVPLILRYIYLFGWTTKRDEPISLDWRKYRNENPWILVYNPHFWQRWNKTKHNGETGLLLKR